MWTVLIIVWIVFVFIPRIFVLFTFCYIPNSSVFSIELFYEFTGLVDIVFFSFWFSTALAAILDKLIYFFLGVCIFNLFEMFTYPIIYWIVRNFSFLTYMLIIIVIIFCRWLFRLFYCFFMSNFTYGSIIILEELRNLSFIRFFVMYFKQTFRIFLSIILDFEQAFFDTLLRSG